MPRKPKFLETLKEARSGEDEQLVRLDWGEDDEDDPALDILDRGSHHRIDEIIRPDGFTIEEDYCKVSGEYTRTVYWRAFPQQAHDGWLARFLRFPYPLHMSLLIQPLPPKAWAKRARTQMAHDAATLRTEVEEGYDADPQRARRLQQTEELIDLIENDQVRPFQVLLAMRLRASSLRELDRQTQELDSMITSGRVSKARLRQAEGFEATLPLLLMNEFYDTDGVRFMHTPAVTTLFPFISSNITHETGVIVGQDVQTGTPIILNRFLQPGSPEAEAANAFLTLQTPNMAVLGASGSGKSYFAKLEMMRWAFQRYPVIVVDPSGEYHAVSEALEGQNIRIAVDSPDKINPLDFSYAVDGQHDALKRKIGFLAEFLPVMLRSEGAERVDPMVKNLFAQALRETYKRFGYETGNLASQQGATPSRMPKLSDVHKMLQIFQRRYRDALVQEHVRPLLAALESFVGDGHLAGLFDHQSTVDLKSDFVVFNIGNLNDNQYPLVMYLVLEHIRTTMFTEAQAQSARRCLLYVDEAQKMMMFPETAKFLEWTARTCRKYGTGLTVMTQNVGVFLQNDDGSENKAGVGVLSNCSTTVLLKQHPSEIQHVQRRFNLTTQEASTLLSARAGMGQIILDGKESCWFSAEHMANQYENAICSTTASERAAIAAAGREHAELTGGMDEPTVEAEAFIDDFDPFDDMPPQQQLPPGR